MKYLFFAIIFYLGIKGGYAQLNADPSLISFLGKRYPETVVDNVLSLESGIVESIQFLNISGLGLESLDDLEYFTGRKELNAAQNALRTLPELPAGIEYLDVSGNMLEQITSLPVTVTDLSCEQNNFREEPVIPAHVTPI